MDTRVVGKVPNNTQQGEMRVLLNKCSVNLLKILSKSNTIGLICEDSIV